VFREIVGSCRFRNHKKKQSHPPQQPPIWRALFAASVATPPPLHRQCCSPLACTPLVAPCCGCQVPLAPSCYGCVALPFSRLRLAADLGPAGEGAVLGASLGGAFWAAKLDLLGWAFRCALGVSTRSSTRASPATGPLPPCVCVCVHCTHRRGSRRDATRTSAFGADV